MLFVAVIWTVLMLFWLVFGGYTGWDPDRPHLFGNTLLPWACVAIIGVAYFYNAMGSATTGALR